MAGSENQSFKEEWWLRLKEFSLERAKMVARGQEKLAAEGGSRTDYTMKIPNLAEKEIW